ncbi:MAG: Crp/Fnr family transcriptional regulator [Methylobacterium mesophilicum]|nr:Crp/Fnr family transcriptional regulator [Methylobacterium mesophilicum]
MNRESILTPFLLSLRARDHVSVEDTGRLETLPWRLRDVKADEEFILEGSQAHESCLIVSGYAARSRHLSDGRRQLTAVHISGDFVDLHSLHLDRMDHAVMALSPCRVAFVAHAALLEMMAGAPRMTQLLWKSTVIDAAIQRAWIVCLGRLSAPKHLAHLLCELCLRLGVVGQTRNGSFDFPVTQQELADMLGLSIVHTNRSLQELRATELAAWNRSRVTVSDFSKLATYAEFDPTYLNLKNPAAFLG